MQHVAIMRSSWKLTQKILSGEKVIESRWYKTKHAPYNKIQAGDTIYFKDCGKGVCISADVCKVLQFDSLTPLKVHKLLLSYGKADGITKDDFNFFYQLFKDKTYCILIFLDHPTEIEPFTISKKGFGAMASWICIDDIEKIRLQ
jgi:hypothetical protein